MKTDKYLNKFFKIEHKSGRIYKLLRATIGSNCEALFAGNTPKINPIEPEIIIVDNVVVSPTDAGKGVITPRSNTPVRPVVVPTKPPIVDKIKASNKNCIRISDCFAPIAFLSPNLLCPFANRYEHYIHYSYTSDNKRYSAYTCQ